MSAVCHLQRGVLESKLVGHDYWLEDPNRPQRVLRDTQVRQPFERGTEGRDRLFPRISIGLQEERAGGKEDPKARLSSRVAGLVGWLIKVDRGESEREKQGKTSRYGTE